MATSTLGDSFSAWLEEVEARCQEEYGLPLSAFDRVHFSEAFEAGLHPASAFEELVVAGLKDGIYAARARIFGNSAEKPSTPLTAADFLSTTNVRQRDRTEEPRERREHTMAEWINFAELRATISLEDVIVRYSGITTLKRDGDKLVGPCPVHGGDSPRAFHADLKRNVWHCFSKCGGGGNQLDFVAKRENLSIRDAALRLQAFFFGSQGRPPQAATTAPSGGPTPTPPTASPSVKTPTPTMAPTTASTAKLPAVAPTTGTEETEVNRPLTFKLDLKHDHPHLMTDRKLKVETCQSFGVGYCSHGILRGMIAIPIHDEDGDLVAYAGRRLKPSDIREYGKYKLPKGFEKARVLFNYHRAKSTMAEVGLILVEGFFAVLKLTEAGLPNVVASMGCELSPYQSKLMVGAKDIIVLYDGDDAGRAGVEAVKTSLAGILPVRVVHLPPGVKPDHLEPKLLRWIVNGVRQLDLAEVSYTPRTMASSLKP